MLSVDAAPGTGLVRIQLNSWEDGILTQYRSEAIYQEIFPVAAVFE
jgi:hypothetical protein